MLFNPSTLVAVLSLVFVAPVLAEPSHRPSLSFVRRSLASKLERRAQKLERQNNAQNSRTLDPSVIAPGLAQDGTANGGDPGQVPSLTSTNNFINFCLGQKVPLTNGQQVKGGSCNSVPMGTIPSETKMPSAKFVNPKNGDTIAANTAFTIQMAIKNLVTGNFVNPQTNYYSAPQQLDRSGTIVGHSHVTVEALTSLDQTTVTDPRKFAFFKGLNEAARGGILSADVTAGLPAGAYRMCSINSAANHQPVLVPVAQRGSVDDCVYFTVGGNGNGNNNNGGNTGGNAGNNGNTGNNGGNTGGNTGNNNGAAPAPAPATGNTGGNKNNGGNKNAGGGRNGRKGGNRGRFGRFGRNGGRAEAQEGNPTLATGNGATSGNTGNTGSGNASAGGNLQTFTGTLGRAAPAVTAGDRGFVVDVDVDGTSFLDKGAALQRSCDVQKDACADAATSSGNKAPLTISACKTQQQACTAAIST